MNQITPEALKKWMDSLEAFQLIDVRELAEHSTFNIGGLLIPLGDIMEQKDFIKRDIPVVLYCKMGIRSQIAIQRLQEKYGFTNLINLQGGVERWKREID